jgi:aspartyl-tRNA(Asn)/glutamyl-tRNA(Gln) amidotransferase subunit C
MKLTKKDVEYVANLARLELSSEESKNFAAQLESILEYMDKLSRLDTSSVKPTTHTLNIKNGYRKDEVVNCPEDVREKILNNAPKKEENFFKVKKVIE